ncbi:MAG: DNA-directed RNA polymerase subunit beta [Proteobacteria bacterium]|nr:DNA-directed RNA polymerase subunit beta [Pseudomonadota bacterium]
MAGALRARRDRANKRGSYSMITTDLPTRSFAKVGDALEIPNLIDIQTIAYARFLQRDTAPRERSHSGLEGLLREVFPVVSYDGNMSLEYVSYMLGKPRYSPDECRELRLTFGMPFRIRLRLTRKDSDEIFEDLVYVGELPVMMGGGEFIINGAERVIVSQLHRSPGVDFTKDQAEGDRALHGCRIIPERGSWIEINVTKKDILAVRIDQSSKIAATTFVRAMTDKYSTDESIIREFYKTKKVRPSSLAPEMYVVSTILDGETDEVLVAAGCQVGDAVSRIKEMTSRWIEVVVDARDALILNTLADDSTHSHEEALLKIYARLRPGNPAQLDKAKKLFAEKFFDENRYRLGKVGRFRINRKLDLKGDADSMVLEVADFIRCLNYLLQLRAGDTQCSVDDIDHLGNRRLRTLDELAAEEMRKGFLKLRRTVQERMSMRNPDEISRIAQLINSKSISSSIEFFFGRSELSQVVDQTNPLSQLTHERRLSALGPGGLNRKRAGFEVRDVHISHYGRICPIETPEGTNIGLIASLALYGRVDEFGFLLTPYRPVDSKGYVNGEIVFLRADEEMRHILAPPEALNPGKSRLRNGALVVRAYGELSQSDRESVSYVDISPKQTVGVSASLIPFLEHDDANRALMGSNMQRQAVPTLRAEAPLVGTGIERTVAIDSGVTVIAKRGGKVDFVDASRIVVRVNDNETSAAEPGVDIYNLTKYTRSNQNTCINQRPLVKSGDLIAAGDVLADGPSTDLGELALGQNLLVAFMPWNGYNFEDSILISERVVEEDRFTTIHIEELQCVARDTKLGPEDITSDIPNVGDSALAKLDESGIAFIGAEVKSGDILVGKVTPKGETQLTPEEKLLRAIFGEKASDVKDTSLRVPPGMDGTVIDVRVFTRDGVEKDHRALAIERAELESVRKDFDDTLRILEEDIYERVELMLTNKMAQGGPNKLKSGSKITKAYLDEVPREQWFDIRLKNDDANEQLEKAFTRLNAQREEFDRRFEVKKAKITAGDDLAPGVLKMAKVYLAVKRRIQPGDKMAGRHGNKGVISIIVPVEDMPYLENGDPVDIVLNPLGVPSRMNVGQVLETHLGWAAKGVGNKIDEMLKAQESVTKLRQFLDAVYNKTGGQQEDLKSFTDEEILELAKNLRNGVPTATPVFDGASEEEIKGLLRLAGLDESGQSTLYDGRTGDKFDRKITVGYMYMLKLNHLVDDKMHARSTGPYSLVTQQPLGGKAQFGGQRFGEMEVWALEAYGAAYTLQEMLTVKSDDVQGRTKMYKNIVDGEHEMDAGMPESFNVLVKEIRSLGINIELETDQ